MLTASVRPTRRGRLVVALSLVAVCLAALSVFGGAPAVSTENRHHAAPHTVIVEPGQTLWDIAGAVSPGQDPRVVVAEIVRLNGLEDAGLIRVGQPLSVPDP